MSFSASHAALEGFRLIGRRPLAMVLWAVTMLVFVVALVALFLAVSWPALAEISLRKHELLGPSDALRLLRPLGAGVAAILPLALILNGVLLAALYRAVLQPERSGFGSLRLGADELRQVVVCIFQLLLQIVFAAAFLAPLAVVWTAVVNKGELGGAGVLLPAVALPLLIVLAVWVAVRLSLAGPMTHAEGAIRFLDSWRLTRGRFWSLLGTYLLANVLGLVLYFVGSMVADAVLAAAGGLNAFHAETLSELAAITPRIGVALAAYLLLQLLLSTLQFAVIYAPQAAAYRDLTREGAA